MASLLTFAARALTKAGWERARGLMPDKERLKEQKELEDTQEAALSRVKYSA
jgi:hypothetical protein